MQGHRRRPQPGFIDAATYLTARCGLSDRVMFQVGEARHVPFDDASFNAVFLQHVATNIADRAALYKRNWSGRVDSNHRPPGPEPTYINNLQTSFTENTRLARLLFGPYLDPIWTLKAKLWRTGRPLDPAWTLLPRW